MFEGLMSRCTFWAAWMALSPAANWAMAARRRASSKPMGRLGPGFDVLLGATVSMSSPVSVLGRLRSADVGGSSSGTEERSGPPVSVGFSVGGLATLGAGSLRTSGRVRT